MFLNSLWMKGLLCDNTCDNEGKAEKTNLHYFFRPFHLVMSVQTFTLRFLHFRGQKPLLNGSLDR